MILEVGVVLNEWVVSCGDQAAAPPHTLGLFELVSAAVCMPPTSYVSVCMPVYRISCHVFAVMLLILRCECELECSLEYRDAMLE